MFRETATFSNCSVVGEHESAFSAKAKKYLHNYTFKSTKDFSHLLPPCLDVGQRSINEECSTDGWGNGDESGGGVSWLQPMALCKAVDVPVGAGFMKALLISALVRRFHS